MADGEADSPIDGEILRRLREERGWSQGKLTQRSGVKQPHISMIESGEQRDTTVAKAVALARALGATVEELTGVPSGVGTVIPPDLAGLNLADPNIRLFLQQMAGLPSEDRAVILKMIAPYIERAEELKRQREERRHQRQGPG